MKCPHCGAPNPLEITSCVRCGNSLMAGSSEYVKLGIEAFRAGRLDEAIRFLEGAVQLDSENARALEYLGVAYGEKGAFFDAVHTLRRSIELSPGSARPHYNLGFLYEKRGEFERAIQEYRAALQADPSYQKARDSLSALEGSGGNTGKRSSYIHCFLHPQVPYSEYCTSCNRPICSECVKMESDHPYCPDCASKPDELGALVVAASTPPPAQASTTAMAKTPPGLAGSPVAEPVPEEFQENLAADAPKVGLWPRAAALFVDFIVLGMLSSVVSMLMVPLSTIMMLPTAQTALSGLSGTTPTAGPNIGALADSTVNVVQTVYWLSVLTILLNILVMGAYFVWMTGRYGQTLGKMVMHAVIVRNDGKSLGYGKAFIRWLVWQGLQLPATVGAWMAGPRIIEVVKNWLIGTVLPAYTQAGAGYAPYNIPDIPGAAPVPPVTPPSPPVGVDLSPLIFPFALIAVSAILGLVNAIVLAADPRHQAIHDKIAGTYVVRD